MSRRVAANVRRLVRTWEALQVELQGQYSLPRLEELHTFLHQTGFLRAVIIVFLTPLSCIATVIVIDVLPLRPPAVGIAHQSATYWIRTFYSFAVVTATVILQFFHASPRLPMTATQLIVATVVCSTFGTLCALALHLLIGFPTPFLYQTIGPPWQGLLFIALWGMWKKSLRENAEQRQDLARYLWLFACQYTMLLLYPVLIFVFGTLTGLEQALFCGCLPMFKLLFRLWANRGVYRLEDQAAVYIVLCVDVFHALMLSCAMQTAVSQWTLVVVVSVDFLQSAAAVGEVVTILERLKRLRVTIDGKQEKNQGERLALRKLGLVALAHTILASRPHIRDDPKIALQRHAREPEQMLPPSRYRVSAAVASQPTSITRHIAVSGQAPSSHVSQASLAEVEYVRLSLKLLHMAEFYILIEFTELAVAVIYAVYLTAMYHLPNRIYYLSLKTLTLDQLKETVVRVLEYAALELLSLVLFVVVLDRLLGFSTLRLLAFTLRKHAVLAQSQLVLWVFFAIQLTLEHLGNDYTFRFRWLRHA